MEHSKYTSVRNERSRIKIKKYPLADDQVITAEFIIIKLFTQIIRYKSKILPNNFKPKHSNNGIQWKRPFQKPDSNQ